MKGSSLAEYVDQQRWLMNSGLFNDGIKNQLFMYGSIVHKEVKAVELAIEAEPKLIRYKIYIDQDLIHRRELYKKLAKSTGLIDMWRFKRMLKRGENLDFENILGRFVKDYCGPKWSAVVEVLDIATYAETFEEQGGNGENPPNDRVSDSG